MNDITYCILLEGHIAVCCNRCKGIHAFTAKDSELVLDQSNPSVPEPFQILIWILTFNCRRCGNKISIDYEVHAPDFNPIEIKNFIDVTGAKWIHKFKVGFRSSGHKDSIENKLNGYMNLN
ncbi:MAG: hypothetical protein RIM99_06400 [Cyclobacteriaceae bacterium]